MSHLQQKEFLKKEHLQKEAIILFMASVNLIITKKTIKMGVNADYLL